MIVEFIYLITIIISIILTYISKNLLNKTVRTLNLNKTYKFSDGDIITSIVMILMPIFLNIILLAYITITFYLEYKEAEIQLCKNVMDKLVGE